jgi:RimJ/RimL family protein N-acetyltransferase
MDEATITPLESKDAGALSALLQRQRREYIAHFHPFGSDAETIERVLTGARRDRFWALRWNGELAGFFMLRGFDEGYARPAFGVAVGEEFAGRGLGRLALAESLRWCRENSCEAVMLKVSPDNPPAKALYVANGFREIGQCERTGHIMMEARLK